ERMDLRVPERLVGVDVPEAGHRPLVEDRRLDRSTPPAEALRQKGGGEPAAERLRAEPDGEMRPGLRGIEQEPGPEPAEVAVGDPRAVVELEHGALVRGRLVAEAA